MADYQINIKKRYNWYIIHNTRETNYNCCDEILGHILHLMLTISSIIEG